MMNPENLQQNEQAQLWEALKLNESLSIADYLKEDLRQFWSQRSKSAAEKFLDAWCRRADASGIRQMQVMAKTLRQHRRGLLNWYDPPISTGPQEGINNKMGALQRRAYGCCNYEYLRRDSSPFITPSTPCKVKTTIRPTPKHSRMNRHSGELGQHRIAKRVAHNRETCCF